MNNLDDDAMNEILAKAVKDFQRATGFPITFGGFHERGIATVTAVAGNRTVNLHGLRVATARGLGGRAMAESRPRFTADYETSTLITHDYDGPVLSEGITALLAFPVVLNGTVRAVLYGGGRVHESPATSSTPGSSFLKASGSVAQALAREIVTQEEVNRRVQETLLAQSHVPGDLLEELRLHQAELRGIINEVADPHVRNRLVSLGERMAKLGDTRVSSPPSAQCMRLSPRELDTLSYVALGHSNAAIGEALGLTESTVKSYVKTAMSKLGASSRHEAVAIARRAGLIL